MAMADNRGTILVEQGHIVAADAFDGAQHVLRLTAPSIAARAKPGHFVHLRCAPDLAMRRPMSIMRADSERGWIDILFKSHGRGTARLAERQEGEALSLIGPIGQPFKLSGYKPRTLLIGGGVGIPPMIFLAEHLKHCSTQPLVLMGSEVPFPFTVKPSQIMTPTLPSEVIGTMPLLEDWGIACRLASQQGYAGCFDGLVTDLARHWLTEKVAEDKNSVEIFACGPTPMLRAVAQLALEFDIPCQVSLEEYMACAVGGCAGCAVLVRDGSATAMKRVCVDGPVFEARDVVFNND